MEGPAVVDAHDHAGAGPRVGHAHAGAEGQGAVRGGHVVHVERLAAGRAAAVEALAVVAGAAAGDGGCGRGSLDRRLDGLEVDGMLGNGDRLRGRGGDGSEGGVEAGGGSGVDECGRRGRLLGQRDLGLGERSHQREGCGR